MNKSTLIFRNRQFTRLFSTRHIIKPNNIDKLKPSNVNTDKSNKLLFTHEILIAPMVMGSGVGGIYGLVYGTTEDNIITGFGFAGFGSIVGAALGYAWPLFIVSGMSRVVYKTFQINK